MNFKMNVIKKYLSFFGVFMMSFSFMPHRVSANNINEPFIELLKAIDQEISDEEPKELSCYESSKSTIKLINTVKTYPIEIIEPIECNSELIKSDYQTRLLNTKYVLSNNKLPGFIEENGIKGDVLVEVSVDKEGNVYDKTIVQTSNKYLNDYCLRIADKLKFLPKISNNVPSNFKVTIPFKIS